jgi:hypothetical protein
MTTIRIIEEAVRRLTPEEIAEFRRWFAEFDAVTWDAQFEEGVQRGRLESFADQAVDDLRRGRCTDL